MFIASAYGKVILYKLHCKDSVSVHRLLAYSSVSIKMLPKASGRITVRLQGVQANGPGGTQGKRRGQIPIDCSHGARPCPKHFMWISHFIRVIAQWRNDSHSIFSSSCGCTLKSSTRQHSWAWPRFRLCLLYLRAVGKNHWAVTETDSCVPWSKGAAWVSPAASSALWRRRDTESRKLDSEKL